MYTDNLSHRHHTLKLTLTAIALSILFVLLMVPAAASAQEKSGVEPHVISLPSGPGSLEGLGETFEPNLSTGTSSYPVKFTAAPGRLGFQPEISINYDGGNANGPWGMGWKASIPYIQRRTENGLPSYDDAQDQFIYANGEKLIALSDGSYRFENEQNFMRFQRIEGGGWEARTPNGIRYVFGETEQARVSNARGTFRWELERVIDTHGNQMQYIYLHEGGYAYPREIRYNFGQDASGNQVYNAVIFNYEPRPDPFTDRRSGAPIRVGLRGTDIQMWAQGKLVRAYRFAYEPERSTGKYSLLIGVTQIGDDGESTLPPHTFTYTQYNADTHAVVTMQNPPPVGLTNPDADLVDINADGLPDLVYTAEDGHRFYLNRGRGRWQAEPIYAEQSPPERLSLPNVRMADMNGDGRADLLVKAGETPGSPFYYYTNTAEGNWERADRVDFGPAPSFNLNDPDVQLIDVNNDKRIDVVLTSGGRMKIWLARAGQWSDTADFDVEAPAAGDAARFSDPYIKVGDITGDRMQDLVFVRDGTVVMWPHNGNGDYEEGTLLLNPPQGLGAQDVQIRAGDLNNDGLIDLVLPGNGQVTYWLSLGDGSFTDPFVIDNTPAFDAQNTAVRLADVDGDGAVELLYSRYPAPADEAMQYVDFSVGPQPFLLASVDNGRGRTIRIQYKSSVEDYVDDWDAGNPWQINLPFPMQVVGRVTVHDANSRAPSGRDYVIDYHYRDGYYDGVQKEFRGFARSQEVKHGDETAATTITSYVYDVGREEESRKGLMLEMEVLAEGGACAGDFSGCYLRTVNQITSRYLVDEGEGKRVGHAYVSRTDSYVHEQQADPVRLRQTWEQDPYGNVIKSFNYGRVCGEDVTCGEDEILTYTEYIYDVERWFLNRPQRIYQTDAAGTVVSEKRMYYDGEPFVGLPLGQLTRGDLTREETSLGPRGGNRFVQTKRFQYDAYGNATGIMDANGNRITVEYDPVAHTFPVTERRHFDDGHTLTYAASYHPGFGQVTAATDYNGHPHIFTYDTFGRIAKIVKPGDTLERPTEQYTYGVDSPRSFIKVEKRVQSGTDDVLTSITYFDGLGRKLQVRSEAGNGQVAVSEAVTFNARQRVRDQFLPYFSSGFDYAPPDPALPKITKYYDAMDRIVRSVNPDGTVQSVVHKPLVELMYDEEDNRDGPHAGTPTISTYDGLERLIRVEQINRVDGQTERYTTRYAYDRLGNLIRVEDAQGNVKTMEYDALSRKVRMVDPDKGEMVYEYDDNGNLIRTRDAKGQEIHYTYDAANRPLVERWVLNDGQPDVINAVYHYDADVSPLHADARNTQGQIAYIEDQAGAVYFSYDPRGNVTGSIRHYAEEDFTFVTRRAYDALDRLVQTTYPDGSVVRYEYDERGLLKRIPGFVDEITYTAAGQRAAVVYSNGARTNYTYDVRQRLSHLLTTQGDARLQDLTYTLDGMNNVLGVADGRPTRTPENDRSQTFTYDNLYRLVRAAGNYGQIDYGYDAIGNLIHKSSSVDAAQLNLGQLRYGENGAGPHALTSAGGVTYQYDANGNLIRKGDTVYTWNARDLLVAADDGTTQSTYVYDASSERVKQTVRRGEQITTTLYPDAAAEVRGDELILYVFDDEQRVAQMIKPFDPSRLLHGFDDAAKDIAPEDIEKRWIIADHLGGASLVLDENGEVVSEVVYYPYGQTRYEVEADGVHHRYTGKELDASGLYYYGARYYDPAIGRFISPDPLYVEQPQGGAANPQLLNLYAYTLNNPVKFVDPDGAEPQNKFYISTPGQGDQRLYFVVEAPVKNMSALFPQDFEEGIDVRAELSLLVHNGKEFVPEPVAPVTLRFTALPNSQKHAVPGTQFKLLKRPPKVRATAACIVNNCFVTRRASGGKFRDMQTFARFGTLEVLTRDKSSTLATLGSADQPMPFFFHDETGTSDMPDQVERSFGLGTTNGADPTKPSHILTGPSNLGSQFMQAQPPKN